MIGETVGSAQYFIEIHIDYQYLKYTDLEWIYAELRSAMKVAKKNPEVAGELQRIGGTPRVLIEYISTKKSIDIEVAIFSIRSAMEIVGFTLLAKRTYEELKRKAMVHPRKKRRIRSNLLRMKYSWKRRRRFEEGREVESMEEDYFTVEF